MFWYINVITYILSEKKTTTTLMWLLVAWILVLLKGKDNRITVKWWGLGSLDYLTPDIAFRQSWNEFCTHSAVHVVSTFQLPDLDIVLATYLAVPLYIVQGHSLFSSYQSLHSRLQRILKSAAISGDVAKCRRATCCYT